MEQRFGMTTALVASKVRGRSTTADQLDVDVRTRGEHISEQTSIPIDPVEPRIRFEDDRISRLQHALEITQRLPAVAFSFAELRRIYLKKSHSRAPLQDNRVAVCDPAYYRFVLGHRVFGLRTAGKDYDGQGGCSQSDEWTCHDESR